MQYTKGEDDISTVAFEMKLLMNDERQTINDDGCRLVAIGRLGDHLDDSLTGNKKRSLEAQGLDFSKKKPLSLKTELALKYLTFN